MTATPGLTDRVVVLARADDPHAAVMAHSLAAQGANVVLTGTDQAHLGRLAASLRDVHGVRVAVFVGDPAEPALAEMVAELFPAADTKS